MERYVGPGAGDPFSAGWLRTGDLGYLSEGELFVTGRIKDIVIAFGRNYPAEDIEWAVRRVEGVRRGRCVAFSEPDGSDDALVIAVEPAADDADGLPLRIRAAVVNSIGIAPRRILVLRRGTIPFTTSGKLQRAGLRSAYADGTLASATLANVVAGRDARAEMARGARSHG